MISLPANFGFLGGAVSVAPYTILDSAVLTSFSSGSITLPVGTSGLIVVSCDESDHTGFTWNSVAMTENVSAVETNVDVSVWSLFSPAIGTHTLDLGGSRSKAVWYAVSTITSLTATHTDTADASPQTISMNINTTSKIAFIGSMDSLDQGPMGEVTDFSDDVDDSTFLITHYTGAGGTPVASDICV